MKTSTTVTLKDSKSINEIQIGTILKKSGDLFIVSMISTEGREHDGIQRALFSSEKPSLYHCAKENYTSVSLISLTTGISYFKSVGSLTDLHRKIVNKGRFEIVDSLEFIEK